jgi:hypothetical protein
MLSNTMRVGCWWTRRWTQQTTRAPGARRRKPARNARESESRTIPGYLSFHQLSRTCTARVVWADSCLCWCVRFLVPWSLSRTRSFPQVRQVVQKVFECWVGRRSKKGVEDEEVRIFPFSQIHCSDISSEKDVLIYRIIAVC